MHTFFLFVKTFVIFSMSDKNENKQFRKQLLRLIQIVAHHSYKESTRTRGIQGSLFASLTPEQDIKFSRFGNRTDSIFSQETSEYSRSRGCKIVLSATQCHSNRVTNFALLGSKTFSFLGGGGFPGTDKGPDLDKFSPTIHFKPKSERKSRNFGF